MVGGGGGEGVEKRTSEAEEERYQQSFVACVDKYAKMSSLRDLDVRVFG